MNEVDGRIKKRSLLGLSLVLGVTAALGVGIWLLWTSSRSGRADPNDLPQVASGKLVYNRLCMACHGVNLEGQPNWKTRKPNGRLPAPPHDQTGHTFHHPDKILFRITKLGLKPPLAPKGYKSDMPSFAGVITDQQIWAVLAFIKSKWPKHVRERSRRINEAAKQQNGE